MKLRAWACLLFIVAPWPMFDQETGVAGVLLGVVIIALGWWLVEIDLRREWAEQDAADRRYVEAEQRWHARVRATKRPINEDR